jgi:hypothetical protein
MSLLASLRARASAALGRTPPEPPVAAHSAEPRASRLGAPAFRAAGAAPTATEPGDSWDRDPETGATLPTGPLVKVGPTEWTQARIQHRHGWFAALAFRGAQGDSAARTRAQESLESWLRHDIPGHGIAWAHPSDLSARLVHWSAGLGFLGNEIPDELRAAMAGSVAWHLQHLDVRTPRRPEEGLRRVIHHAGRVIGGLTFPELEESRAAWSEGLTGLGEDLPALMHADGSARDVAPLALAESIWFAMLARAVARANGVGFPGPADAALSRGARFLERLTGSIGTLPGIGDRPVDTVLAVPGYPIGWSLWNLCVGFGIDAGEGAPKAKDDPRLAWLGLPTGTEPPAAGGKNWAMWVWREGGTVLAEMKIKNKPSRVVATMGSTGRGSPLTHPAPLSLLWEVGDIAVLGDPGPSLDHPELAAWLGSAGAHNVLTLDNRQPPADTAAELDIGRVDGKKARIEGHHDGWAKVGIPVHHQRKILLNQARCVVTDRLTGTRGRMGRHAVQILWQMGPGWELTPDGTNYTAKQGNMTVVIQLPTNLSWTVVSGRANPDPAGWMGTKAAPCLVGSGGVEGETEFVCSFEIR